MLRIYNTLSGKKELFKPLNGKRVNLFVCGPTVYDLAHVGHARTYIAFDIVARYLRHQGYQVNYVQNITDLDDKIIARAAENKKDPQKLAREVETTYFEDMKTLGIFSVTTYARATEHIEAIIAQINTLIRREYAYVAGGNVYYDISKFPSYGNLSGQKLEKLHKGVRIEPDSAKQHPYDFALWKAAKEGEPKWPSPWGAGRPGWHIEDTAITDTFFGAQYDIHGGARDLIFPHHECEIAQMESASGKSPMVKYWMHAGFLLVQNTKMSKSLGNFLTIRDFLKAHAPETLRMIIASAHYRSPIDYTEAVAKQAEEQLKRFREFAKKLIENKAVETGKKTEGGLLKKLEETERAFLEKMEDDFNTPAALAALSSFIRVANPLLEKEEVSQKAVGPITAFLRTVDEIFGFGLLGQEREPISAEVQKLVTEREKARKEKKWDEADRLRKEIETAGYVVDDTPQGPRIKSK
ncbi:MAG: cysteine--tRNA ligase [bacterium]|nr:cysteine--tRNA ligase [bacterium]